MEYQLTAEITAPAENHSLDALQQQGVAALLDEQLDALAGIDGPDGIEIEPVDHQISVTADGAVITWVLEAPALAFAEDAAQHALKELLERTELLAAWSVRRCEVTASDDELAAALEADGKEGGGRDGYAGEETGFELLVDSAELTEQEQAARRAVLVQAAAGLRAFGPDAFGHQPDSPDSIATAEQAELLAGALMRGVEIMTEELFADIQTLEDTGLPASEVDALWVLDELPARQAEQYTSAFAKRFLITLAILGYRLSQPGWLPPLSTAEALALHLAKAKATGQLVFAGLAAELPADEMLAAFDAVAFEDADHEALYADDADGPPFDEWFLPFEHLTTALHPYLADLPADIESDDEPE